MHPSKLTAHLFAFAAFALPSHSAIGGTFSTVVIDAGHGGHDHGGIRSNLIPEKGVALDVARRVQICLKKSGLRTVMTRSTDAFVTLDDRVAVANAQRRAIFVSIHFNAALRTGANGIETFYSSATSKTLARLIQRNAMKTTASENQGVKSARFCVLRKAKIPAALIECGFLTNPQDVQRSPRKGTIGSGWLSKSLWQSWITADRNNMKFPQILSLAILSLLTACQSAPVELSPNPSVTVPVPSAPTPAPDSSLTVTPQKVSYSSCNVEGPYLALTFDDGPSPALTPKLLDLLKEKGVKATFFIVGENAARYPDIVRRIAAEGHEIGNHTWTHAWLTRIGESAIREEISKSSALIEQITGRKPSLIRPPYGAATRSMDRWITQEFGLRVILWSVDPLDWKYRDSDHVKSVILREAQPGSIILSHDIHATTVAAIPAVLAGLSAKGYRFVTVSELLAMDHPPPTSPKPTATINGPPAAIEATGH